MEVGACRSEADVGRMLLVQMGSRCRQEGVACSIVTTVVTLG